MKLDEIKTFKNKTARAIRNGELHQALRQMREFSERIYDWELSTAIDSLSQNYTYMLRYVASGVNDPEQQQVYDNLANEAMSIVDTLTRKAFMNEHPGLYYSVARTMGARMTVSSLANDYINELTRLNNDIESIADPRRTEKAENILRDLFNRIWTHHPFKTEDVSGVMTILGEANRQLVGSYARSLVVSALTLGMLEFYDARRLEILLDVYMSNDDDNVRLPALIGALASFYRYRSRPVPKDVALRLAAAKEHKDWMADFTSATVEFMRATDTDRISTEMDNKMKSAIKNFDPELRKKLQSGDFDIESLTQGNPEWEGQLSNSELVESLKELQELQAEGSDVFMASFSKMKQFPFFSEISNWFLPFYDSYSKVAEIDNFEGTMGRMLAKMPIICDSDKYSLILSFSAVPASNRETFLSALEMQWQQVRDSLSEMDRVSSSKKRCNIINKYVQNIFRFYKLFRRKNEFFPLFSQSPDMLEVKALGKDFKDETHLETIAMFFFKHEFWPQAIDAFSRLDRETMPDASRSQKIGYAYEMVGNLTEAIARYEEAELLNGGSIWTLKHLASALRRNGQAKSAATYYKRISDLQPEDGNIALSYGYALTEDGRLEEAEAQFHKAAYLMPDSSKPLRGLAWIQFRNNKFRESIETYSKFISGGNEDDYLNYGHALLASGDLKEAITAYRAYCDNFGKDISEAIKTDEKYLMEAGCDASKLPLIIEAVKYAR